MTRTVGSWQENLSALIARRQEMAVFLSFDGESLVAYVSKVSTWECLSACRRELEKSDNIEGGILPKCAVEGQDGESLSIRIERRSSSYS
jgi:hypothetical protein